MFMGKIIVAPETLDHSFIPEKLPTRENIRSELFLKIRQFFSQSSGKGFKGIHISGSVGSGKTVLSRRVAADLKTVFRENLIICYVNCRFSRRVYRVLAQIASQISSSLPQRGLSKDEFLELIFLATKERAQRLLIILDEIDSLFWGNEGEKATDMLYSLSRYLEKTTFSNFFVATISISRTEEFIFSWLDPATRASFIHEKKHLEAYGPGELVEILRYRAKLAFRNGTISEESLSYLANFVANQAWGNARTAIDLLRLAGEIAEHKNEDVVRPEHIRLAIKEYALIPALDMEKLIGLGRHKLILLLATILALKNSNRSYVTRTMVQEYYRELCAEYGEEPRKTTQIWRYLREIEYELSGIVEVTVSGKNQRGRSTRISINVPLDTLEKNIVKILKKIPSGLG